MTLDQEIHQWVEEKLDGYTPLRTRDPKVIRDPVSGLIRIGLFEASILDCPILQRLRYIHQTACAFLLYPGARHTRFEHSLGTMAVVDRYCEALNAVEEQIGKSTRAQLRLAALFHDAGHCVFSHLGESIYESSVPEVGRAKTSEGIESASELIAYYIVDSTTFQDFMADHVFNKYRYPTLEEPRWKDIAGYIVGRSSDPKYSQYKADLINGPGDADKLDYSLRDAHYTGIRLPVDLEMITREARIDAVGEKGWRRLTFNARALSILEQLVFSKLQMYSILYQHHKVMATECMVRAIFELMREEPNDVEPLRFDSVSAFLDINDGAIFNLDAHSKGETRKMVRRLKNRQLLKKVLVLNYSTISRDTHEKIDHFARAARNDPRLMDRLRTEIAEDTPLEAEGGKASIWIDIPRLPVLRELAFAYLRPKIGDKETLGELIGSSWVQEYKKSKWTGYVFGPPDPDLRSKLKDVAKRVIETEFEIDILPEGEERAKIGV